MQLPKELQHFSETTLIVLTDEQEAKFLLAGGDSLEQIDSTSLARGPMSDSEGSFASSEGTHVGSALSDKHDTPRKKKFAAVVAERIAQIVQNGQAEDVRLVSPKEMMNLIEKKLPDDVVEHIQSRLPKDIMKLSNVEVLKRIFEKDEEK
jgi:protein required for attachment to host cells